MSSGDILNSLAAGPEVEIGVKGSRFLGRAFPADTEEEARTALEVVRRRHHDATHHCWAFRLGDPGQLYERHSDDGEPSGSAGVPILGSLQRAGVVRAAVVVTRYFGGVKLGTGGLTRAYGEAARRAVEAAPRRVLLWVTELEIRGDYDQLGLIEGLLGRSGGAVREIRRDFAPDPVFEVAILRGSAGMLRDALVEASAGRVRVAPISSGIVEQ